MIKLDCFLFKKGFIWVGWILTKTEQEPIKYCNDNPYVTLRNETGIRYITFSFSQKVVFKRLENKALKIVGGRKND